MGTLLQFVGDWGHALAAVLFAAIGIFILRRRDDGIDQRMLAVALLLTSCWSLYVSFGGVDKPLTGIGENIRNAAWLLLLFIMLRRGPADRVGSMVAIGSVYAAVAGLILLQTFTDLIWRQLPGASDLHRALVQVSLSLHMMTAVGSLMLVHHLYVSWPPQQRGRVALLLGALAAMWTYDFNLYVIGYFAIDRASELYALRGPMMAMLAPVIAAGMRRDRAPQVQLSRALTFRALSLISITLYVILIAAAAVAIELIAGPYARAIQIGCVFFMAVSALVLLPSPRMRAMWKVQVAKHVFQHRYDYRTEWMRFGDTIGRPGSDAPPLGERVAKAVADITDSPAAILMLRSDDGALTFETHWNWDGDLFHEVVVPAPLALLIERSGWIIDIDRGPTRQEAGDTPDWMRADPRAWALVPLIHFGRLIGAILLARPLMDRRLDWEDLDMLRTAGRQAASYLSEAQGQQALDDAQRFDEFNRRFAFIIHDVKNLVSQLSLLARNAERHADNADFRADMVLTLRESVGKMNDMLARLSQHNKGRAEEPRPMSLDEVAARVARSRSGQHEIRLTGSAPLALADPARVEQIIIHLLQNAIDASAGDRPVEIRLGGFEQWAMVEVIDQGRGMSAEYIRRDLFKPFSSSKAGGFGIGAFEARALAQSMGGSIGVESKPGVGSRFTLRLPTAPREGVRGEAA
ncbi:Multi-sensor signal transduction histidine kinase [Sphingobium herbicidovorans NBRC 16415]|uniref:histidine kinase n=1 Tax=Sphingobium herbicidovorans (strain ATCC 700291 / DSM 11019 / CCUG 56400 / KCTC 2939 / LMG 18315 / NBRC 16415 / MH) TaxID=1219045 RepID=A0A086PFD1_SPHHM|nr:XrtA/PEP-CTERM system histidine kinase PrsK [Sphingobium herbicidovorans]KFG92099.1 Multi-sensor signal transduction histidine kinase [Sphingobium herbicidovorans NBRC 16415]